MIRLIFSLSASIGLMVLLFNTATYVGHTIYPTDFTAAHYTSLGIFFGSSLLFLLLVIKYFIRHARKAYKV